MTSPLSNHKQRVINFERCLVYFQTHKLWPPNRPRDKPDLEKESLELGNFWLLILLGAYSLNDKQAGQVFSLDPKAFHLMNFPAFDSEKAQWILACNEGFRQSRHLPTPEQWIQEKVDECVEYYRTRSYWPPKKEYKRFYLSEVFDKVRSGSIKITPEQCKLLTDADPYVFDPDDTRKKFDELIQFREETGTWPTVKSELGRWWRRVKLGHVALDTSCHNIIRNFDSTLRYNSAVDRVVQLVC